MAESPSHQPPSSPQVAAATDSDQPAVEYWCYQCDNRVTVETLLADHPQIVCNDCKSGFVESIAPAPLSRADDQFIQVLNLISQMAREGDAPPSPPSDRPDPPENDYLRIELDGWEEDDDDEDENEEENEEENEVEEQSSEHEDEDGTVGNEDPEEEEEERDSEEDIRRARRDVLRLRLRDFDTLGTSRRNRILDWADILMGLEDHSIEFRLQGGGDGYVGNPGDYVDAAGFEAVLQNLAENCGNCSCWWWRCDEQRRLMV